MSEAEPRATPPRLRREPPHFRRLTVRRIQPLTPWMVRVTLAGADLRGLSVELPAASVRLLFPPPGAHDLVMPTWNGNEFLQPDGRRSPIRTFTPLRIDAGALEIDLDFVIHGRGIASEWVGAAAPGDEVALSGPGRGYAIETDASDYLVGGDETAIPAIGQLLEAFPSEIPIEVHIEVAHPEARLALPANPRAVVTWWDLAPGATAGDALAAAVRGAEIGAGTRVWIAGEAAAVQRIRRHLFDERGMSRSRTSVRGYWKHGRSAEADGDG